MGGRGAPGQVLWDLPVVGMLATDTGHCAQEGALLGNGQSSQLACVTRAVRCRHTDQHAACSGRQRVLATEGCQHSLPWDSFPNLKQVCCTCSTGMQGRCFMLAQRGLLTCAPYAQDRMLASCKNCGCETDLESACVQRTLSANVW